MTRRILRSESRRKKKAIADFMVLLLVVAIVAAVILLGEFAYNNLAGVAGIIKIRENLHIFMVNDDVGTELVSLLNARTGNYRHIELLGSYVASGDKIAETRAGIIGPVKATMDSAYANYDFTFTAMGSSIKYNKGVPEEIQDNSTKAILSCPSLQSVTEEMKNKIVANTENGVLFWPTESKHITSGFGGRELDTNKGVCDCHGGIDIRGQNTDVYAAASGTVTFAGDLTSKGFGNIVVIGHPVSGAVSAGHPGTYDFYTYYVHLSSISVGAGDEVAAGRVIGKIGNTGVESGEYHLHFQIGTSEFPKDETAIDPCGFLDLTGTTGLKCEHEQVAVCKYVAGMVSGKSVRSYETDIPLPGAKSGNSRGTVIFKQWD
jgi:murein DD-endopeptidase MepM/ murein hydrolase activator NlpD